MRLLSNGVASCCVVGAILSAQQTSPKPPAPPAPQTQPKLTLSELSGALESLTRRVSPAVVQVFVSGYGLVSDEGSSTVGFIARQRGSGSGVIVDAAGYIMTNAHVVEGAQKVRVLLPHNHPGRPAGPPSPAKTESSLVEAKILGVDKEADLALLKVDRARLPVIRFANSDAVHEGQLALAIGSPLGLHNSISMGVVSAAARQLRPDDTMVYIQTDAPINPGNSGGPLLNAGGALIGINTFILSQSGGSEGVGFAIPSNIVKSVYQQLRKNGHVHHGEIGVSVQAISPALASGLGLPQDWGVLLADVVPGGPADAAGLKIGDIVLSLDGRAVEDSRTLEASLYRRTDGEKATVVVQRGADKLTAQVTVLERPDSGDRLAEIANPKDHLVAKLGILCIAIDKRVSELLPALRVPYGLVVAAKSKDLSGQEVDLSPGDVIHSMNGEPLSTVESLRTALDQIKSGDAAVFQVERSGKLRFVAITLE